MRRLVPSLLVPMIILTLGGSACGGADPASTASSEPIRIGQIVSLTGNYLFAPPWGGTAPKYVQPSALLRRGCIKPWPAGAYLIKARKRVYTLTPMRPKIRERVGIGGLVKPTTPRQSS